MLDACAIRITFASCLTFKVVCRVVLGYVVKRGRIIFRPDLNCQHRHRLLRMIESVCCVLMRAMRRLGQCKIGMLFRIIVQETWR